MLDEPHICVRGTPHGRMDAPASESTAFPRAARLSDARDGADFWATVEKADEGVDGGDSEDGSAEPGGVRRLGAERGTQGLRLGLTRWRMLSSMRLRAECLVPQFDDRRMLR